MEPELTNLAVAGATALVTQMVTDGWEQARDRVVTFFARRRNGEEVEQGEQGGQGGESGEGGEGREEAVRAELDTSRAELVAARDADDEETAADVHDEWRIRLRRALRADPQAAAELRALLDELVPPADGTAREAVHNVISGGVQHGTVIQAHTVGDLSIGGHGRAQGDPGSPNR
ncbi:hypothetical protein GCM10010145_42220 [Streptomyces ruber]|uniref:Uncharacterized protein n=2 Tax=Streptomyces TaxID=1883 RepID=A0A918ETZ0_9ACTN|nr:hypothetical protein [Streptomyces ruber]GGQ67897.1 hypothetical protein GCM10010145_42220 [Streptomyces ruber]